MERHIFFEVLTLDNPSPEPFAVVRIDTDKRVGNGCEAVVESLHLSEAEAYEVATRMRGMPESPRPS